MQTGTIVLLERMKTHPEEFFGAGSYRWDRIINDAKPYLPEEDSAALDQALCKLHVDRFNERVLKQLAGEGDGLGLFAPSPFGAVAQQSLIGTMQHGTITAEITAVKNAILNHHNIFTERDK